MDDKDLKKIAFAHKIDVADDGFAERIVRQLPERKSMLPQIVMITFITIGVALTLAIQGFTSVFEQISSLLNAISQAQIPSLSSIITYISALALTGFIGFSVAQVDVE